MDSTRPSDNQLPRAGDVVGGKYQIEAVIGTGGMGVVLAAMDTSLGRRVAIKFLMPQKADRDGATARFAREARAAASIQSEHVVRVFEVSTLPNGASYIVMEHLAGADLGQVLTARGRLPITEAVDDLLQACEALGEAHGRGIVHRDLKPQNLFVTERNDGSPCVKVLDFGISKAVDEDAPNLTATDTVMGTPLYMSPEQVRSLKNVDHRSDIWSLGAILFELLAGAPVFDAQTVTALCAAIAMDPPTPLRARLPDAPAELEAIILRCLHKDPNGRFQDVAALADALAVFASDRGRLSASRVARVVRAGGMQGAAVPVNAQATATAGPWSQSPTWDPAAPPSAPATSSHPSLGPAVAPTVQGVPPTVQGVPPTVGMGSTGMPGMAPAQTLEEHVWSPQRTTQQTWQHHTGGVPSVPPPLERRGSNGLVIAVVGVVAAVFVLVLLVGGGVFLYSRRAVATAPEQPSVAPPASPTAAATAAPTVVALGPGGPKKAVAPDAGIAPGKASAAPSGTPPAKSKADEELEAQKRTAALVCSSLQASLRTNDPKNNDHARQVKLQVCVRSFGPDGRTCERAACRSACSMLQDQQCLSQLDLADRSFPAKF